MMLNQRSQISAYMMHLLSEGQVAFLREDAQKELGVSRRAFLDAAERQQRRKHLLEGGRYSPLGSPKTFQVNIPADLYQKTNSTVRGRRSK